MTRKPAADSRRQSAIEAGRRELPEWADAKQPNEKFEAPIKTLLETAARKSIP
jgi:hypothetical protein